MKLSEEWNLTRLKWLCQVALQDSVGYDNVIAMLIAAHKHHAKDLEYFCKGFIRKNLPIMKQHQSLELLTEYPDLLLEIARM